MCPLWVQITMCDPIKGAMYVLVSLTPVLIAFVCHQRECPSPK